MHQGISRKRMNEAVHRSGAVLRFETLIRLTHGTRTRTRLIQIATSNTRVRPCEWKSNCANPTSSLKARSIRADPNPLCSGSSTGGPPLSCQQSFSRLVSPSFFNSHATLTCPLPFESAPYLTALVASSCNAIVSSSDLSASSHIIKLLRIASEPDQAVKNLETEHSKHIVQPDKRRNSASGTP
jgi:hypothetical protein